MRHADGGPEVLRVAVGGDHDRATESAEGIAGALQHPAQGDRRWLAITHRIRDPCPEDRADEGLAMPGRADGADIIRIGAGADQRGIPTLRTLRSPWKAICCISLTTIFMVRALDW